MQYCDKSLGSVYVTTGEVFGPFVRITVFMFFNGFHLEQYHVCNYASTSFALSVLIENVNSATNCWHTESISVAFDPVRTHAGELSSGFIGAQFGSVWGCGCDQKPEVHTRLAESND